MTSSLNMSEKTRYRKMMKRLFVALLLLGAAAAAMPAAATDFDIIEVPPGQTVNVYFQINLSGEVYINIGTADPECPFVLRPV